MNQLSDRDYSVLTHFNKFHQSTSKQIRSLFFPSLSYSPVERCLRRLTTAGYLRRIETERLIGGSRGGSGQFVYQLDNRGYWLLHDDGDGWKPTRGIRRHSLAIVDLYVALKELERAGKLIINAYSAEPDSHVTIDGVILKPDMYTDLTVNGQPVSVWWEVDLGTESQKQVRGKLDAVVRALRGASAADWPVFPGTIWVAVDVERERELKWLVKQLSEEVLGHFRVCQLNDVATVLGIEA